MRAKRRQGKLKEHGDVLKKKGESEEAMDAEFSMFEMTRALEAVGGLLQEKIVCVM